MLADAQKIAEHFVELYFNTSWVESDDALLRQLGYEDLMSKMLV